MGGADHWSIARSGNPSKAQQTCLILPLILVRRRGGGLCQEAFTVPCGYPLVSLFLRCRVRWIMERNDAAKQATESHHERICCWPEGTDHVIRVAHTWPPIKVARFNERSG